MFTCALPKLSSVVNHFFGKGNTYQSNVFTSMSCFSPRYMTAGWARGSPPMFFRVGLFVSPLAK